MDPDQASSKRVEKFFSFRLRKSAVENVLVQFVPGDKDFDPGD